MEFNQAPNYPYGVGPAYPQSQYHDFNPRFRDRPPPGLHVAPLAQPPPMSHERANWSNSYNGYAYGYPPDHSTWASSTFGTQHPGLPAQPPPPSVVRPTFYPDPVDEWQAMRADCNAFFDSRPPLQWQATRESQQSQRKPTIIKINTPQTRVEVKMPSQNHDFHEEARDQTEETPTARRPRQQRNPNTFVDERVSTTGSIDYGSYVSSSDDRQPRQPTVGDYEGSSVHPATAIPREEARQPGRVPRESRPRMHPSSNEQPFDGSGHFGFQRDNAGPAANISQLRDEGGNAHHNARLDHRQRGSVPTPARERRRQPAAPEAPSYRYGNFRNRGGGGRRETDQQMREATEHMHATDPYVHVEPPRGVDTGHLVAQIRSIVDQYGSEKDRISSPSQRSQTSRDPDDPNALKLLLSLVDICGRHLDARDRAESTMSSFR
ncbi:hypothetical protein B0T10DRAFT_495685 [Thelonectria olida]|uniref:Uncharacterized protein n=1 Tax=Thelonectria olida TaxID=1576542 RepID=A0A9P8VXL9_9HYPO|nr:hypothetical protein B0T10DRAFT_495685 [Thelonectria olida]